MKYSLEKAHWEKSRVIFGLEEEILNVAAYHKNPNVGQILLWRAWSMGMTAKYFVLLTSKRVIIVALNNVASLKLEKVKYVKFENVRIMQEDGALEVEADEKKLLRIYPETWANKLNQVDLQDLIHNIKLNK